MVLIYVILNSIHLLYAPANTAHRPGARKATTERLRCPSLNQYRRNVSCSPESQTNRSSGVFKREIMNASTGSTLSQCLRRCRSTEAADYKYNTAAEYLNNYELVPGVPITQYTAYHTTLYSYIFKREIVCQPT